MKDKEFEKICMQLTKTLVSEINAEAIHLRFYDANDEHEGFATFDVETNGGEWYSSRCISDAQEATEAVRKVFCEMKEIELRALRDKVAEMQAKLEVLESRPHVQGKPASECECETVTEKEVEA